MAFVRVVLVGCGDHDGMRGECAAAARRRRFAGVKVTLSFLTAAGFRRGRKKLG